MMMKNEELKKFNKNFQSFIAAYQELEHHQHRIQADKTIALAEVHTIVAIAENQPINLIQLAELRNISRSAVTQMVNRLEQKDLVSKISSSSHAKIKYLDLTEKGKRIYEIHQTQQKYLEEQVASVLSEYSVEELNTVVNLMTKMKELWQNLPW